MTPLGPFYSRRELASLLKVSVATIDRACRAGRLRYYRVEGQVRITQEAVLAYLERGRRSEESRVHVN